MLLLRGCCVGWLVLVVSLSQYHIQSARSAQREGAVQQATMAAWRLAIGYMASGLMPFLSPGCSHSTGGTGSSPLCEDGGMKDFTVILTLDHILRSMQSSLLTMVFFTSVSPTIFNFYARKLLFRHTNQPTKYTTIPRSCHRILSYPILSTTASEQGIVMIRNTPPLVNLQEEYCTARRVRRHEALVGHSVTNYPRMAGTSAVHIPSSVWIHFRRVLQLSFKCSPSSWMEGGACLFAVSDRFGRID
jgi:hypothetical protein